ncbi:protein FAF-like, chloroplastic [Brachypodium distachyon]|uniref:FAF domain-containing protein n=1 Tax=Brachypodium distachyon TaxID=15368 RepID=A0A0Q3ECS1_BRADI|nr:protein FAF-like, chloroplastic [Brachypodium distachyon]KQJ85550.1 hypothetical protein BRADI_4g00100v3 [Brachypodium distachyon]|eukprot:XP_010238848.1 protein FAF-like, chloroplastic [Brachypodium distachyon]
MTVAVMPALDAHTRIPAPSQLDVAWNSIFQTKPPPAMAPKASSMAMSNQSRLDLCTESLGCETGSHDDIMECLYARTVPEAEQPWEEPTQEEEEEEEEEVGDHGVLTAVRYHRAPRAFPPPLPSMSRRLQMRPVRRDGRLVVEAVATKPHGYLHARRQEGRLRLCFVDCRSVSDQSQSQSQKQSISPMQQQSMVPQEEEEDEDDEVKVVDRGTMVEVVAASGGKASRIVINKFVGGAPMSSDSDVQQPSPPVAAAADHPPELPGMRRVPSSTTTLAAAVAAAASSGMDDSDDDDDEEAESECETIKEKKKLVFSWRAGAGAGDREELVRSVRRCRQLRRHKQPLFILEPYYTINIAT